MTSNLSATIFSCTKAFLQDDPVAKKHICTSKRRINLQRRIKNMKKEKEDNNAHYDKDVTLSPKATVKL